MNGVNGNHSRIPAKMAIYAHLSAAGCINCGMQKRVSTSSLDEANMWLIGCPRCFRLVAAEGKMRINGSTLPNISKIYNTAP